MPELRHLSDTETNNTSAKSQLHLSIGRLLLREQTFPEQRWMTLLAQQTVLLQERAARNVGVRTIRENQTCAEEHSMKHWCGIDLSAVTQNRQLKVEIKGFKTG